MAMIFEQESRTFSEYLLVPNLTPDCTPDAVDLSTAIVHRKGSAESRLRINVPVVSAMVHGFDAGWPLRWLAAADCLSFTAATHRRSAEMVPKPKIQGRFCGQ